MITPNFGAVCWRKSSYSNGGDGNCVEVADGFRTVVPVRDSKRPTGPVLHVSAAAFTSFVTGIKSDNSHLA